jgi:hypothetical protein
MVEGLDPRKILKDSVKLLDYEPLGLNISVYVYDFSIDDTHLYRITKENGHLNFFIENSSLNLDSIDSFLKVISHYAIQGLTISNGVTETLLFECDPAECMDYQRSEREHSASKIQKNFRRSRDYAAWKYSPQKLQEQGYFNQLDFGKKRNKNFIQEANARSRRKGTQGTFGRWCRKHGLDVDGKVSLRCINKAKKSGNTKLIRRAVFAQNIKAYAGARKSSFGARTRPRRCKRLTKRRCRSDPQCRWSGRRKGKRVKHRCVRRRKVYEGPALPRRTSFGKKKRGIKLPNNKKLGAKLKGYNTPGLGSMVAVKINGKIRKFRISKVYRKGKPVKGAFKVTIKGKRYTFKSKGPGRHVTLTKKY